MSLFNLPAIKIITNVLSLFVTLTICALLCGSATAKDIEFYGDCDASTAIAISNDSFFVIGDETKPKARLYNTQGKFLSEIPLKGFLAPKLKREEPDLEASARVRNTIFIIGSHGRDEDGVLSPARNQLLGLDYKSKKSLIFEQVGSTYTKLRDFILEEDQYKKFEFDRKPIVDNPDLAPKSGETINIEGLAVARNGEDLLLGLRSPLFENKAILVPIKNPFKLIKGEDEKPNFGEAILLDLDGQGIRSIEFWPEKEEYLIVSGNVGNKRGFQLYTWTGDKNEKPVSVHRALSEEIFNPEAIVVFPDENKRVLLLSDDGSLTDKDGVKCKKLPKSKRHFVGRWIPIAN